MSTDANVRVRPLDLKLENLFDNVRREFYRNDDQEGQ